MTSFSASTHAEAVVLAPQQDIWDALVDPELMARFTPFLKKITADGDHWVWELSGLNVLGVKVAPAFTEKMVFSEPDRIEFRHDPPAGTSEQAGVEGWYALTPVDGGTRLVTDLEITVDLPLPKVSGRAVRATMKKVIDTMGDRFSHRLLDHLGAEERTDS
ncbi:CoxG family protein [Nocardioides halotolerans]|uniref:CoxG family protein n=1 Tax=Nocardioides halotolerans TaxID=433660 RepID=UPI0003FF5DB1|nr:SRPBCC family protein [Nocardioides halotolerans]